MVFTIKKKLWLGIGTLLGLFILVGLISFHQKKVVDEKIKEIMEIDEPVSAATYEMEINLYETGFSLFSYIHRHDPEDLNRIEKDKGHFKNFLKKYHQLAETEKGKELGFKADQGYKEFTATADEMIRIEDEQAKKVEVLFKKLDEIDELLDEKIQASIKPDDPHAYRKLEAAMEIEINTNGIAKGLGNFLRTHRPQYEARVTKDEQDFKRYFEIYKSLPLSPQEREWAKQIGLLFNESAKLTREIIDLDRRKLKGLEKFIQIRQQLDDILDDEIQAQTHRNLEKAKGEVLWAAKRTNLIITITLFFALSVGILLGIRTTSSIVKPVSQLLLSTETIAKGDLSQRVDIQSKDEIGLLGESFNYMVERLQKTMVSRDYVENIIQSMSDTLIVVSPEGKIETVNPATCALSGYGEEELLGQMYDKILAEESDASVLIDSARKGAVRNAEKTYLSKDGRQIPVLFSSSVLRGGGEGVVCIAKDITDLKRAEETIKESEEKYRSIFENAVEGIYRSTLEGRFLNVNPAMARIFGYESPHQMVAGITDIAQQFYVEPATRQAFTHSLERGGEVLRLEYEAYRKDGSTIWIADRARAVRGTDGALLFLEGFIEDITERKQTEEELQKSEERARGLAKENVVVAEIGRIISSTLEIEKTYELFAVEVRKVIPFDRIAINIIYPEKDSYVTAYIEGKDIAGFRPGDTLPLVGSLTKEVARTRSSMLIDRDEVTSRFPHLLPFFHAGFRSFIAVPLISKDQLIGVLHIFSVNSKAYMEADKNLAERIGNQIAGAIANAQLFLEHQRLEKEKSILEEQFRQSQKMEAIGKLAGGIAHDFNNLLTVIKGYTQLSLYDLKKGDPIRENITVIQKAADRAADLTRQLLAFSRRQVMEIRVHDLNSLLKNMDKMLHRVIGEDIELVTILAEDLGRVKADPGQIEQAIMNLAVNARDAMPSGGKLTIETANVELDETYARNHVAVTPGRYVMLAVSDTGVGIPPEVKERIFEPFFTTKEVGKGTGLGLSTVYGIVKQSGGNIWVYSEPGQETTFKIYLPRVDEALTETKEIREEEVLHGSETILVAEDEEGVRKLAVQILEKQGYRVLEVSEGSEAIRICKENEGPIHLLLTDVVMPGMSGRELADRLLSLHTEIKVLYMSGYPDNAIVHHGVLEKGMNYIQKPFTVEGLVRKVRQALNGKSKDLD